MIIKSVFFKLLFLAALVLSTFAAISPAQNKVDLAVNTQATSETARGGEAFAYTATVTNLGSIKARKVMLFNSSRVGVTSAVPGAGICVEAEGAGMNPGATRCELGDLEAGASVVVNFSIKLTDFDQPDPLNKSPVALPTAPFGDNGARSSRTDEREQTIKSEIATLDVYAEEPDETEENNRAEVTAELLPSLNKAPRVHIISPKNEAIITRSTKKICKVTFTIKAFDPDGTIEKVRVNTQQFGISVEYPENKYVIDGKKYSIREVEANMPAFQKYFGGEAVKIGKDTYSFTLKNPKYGLNVIFIDATDNGKRTGVNSVRLTVKGDNTIKFIRPLNNSVIQPGSDLKIETLSRLNDGKPVQMELIGNALCCEARPMRLISRNGDSYVHQYLLKNAAKGQYYFQIFLMEDTGAFTYSEAVRFTVTEKPRVRITSIKNGQVFKAGEEIPIEVEAFDPDGDIKEVSISVNGRYDRNYSWRTGGHNKSGYISGLRQGIYKISAKASDDSEVEVESETITIIVK
jgi:hypothetical protein